MAQKTILYGRKERGKVHVELLNKQKGRKGREFPGRAMDAGGEEWSRK